MTATTTTARIDHNWHQWVQFSPSLFYACFISFPYLLDEIVKRTALANLDPSLLRLLVYVEKVLCKDHVWQAVLCMGFFLVFLRFGKGEGLALFRVVFCLLSFWLCL